MKIYEIIAELDKSKRDFLKTVGKGAAGVAGAAALSALPKGVAQAATTNLSQWKSRDGLRMGMTKEQVEQLAQGKLSFSLPEKLGKGLIPGVTDALSGFGSDWGYRFKDGTLKFLYFTYGNRNFEKVRKLMTQSLGTATERKDPLKNALGQVIFQHSQVWTTGGVQIWHEKFWDASEGIQTDEAYMHISHKR